MEKYIIDVGTEFYPRPMGRKIADGQHSGEAFRVQFLMPFFQSLTGENKNKILVLNFNNVSMAGSSFLEEAFGGLVRSGINKDLIKKHLLIEVDPELKELIEDRIFTYINRA